MTCTDLKDEQELAILTTEGIKLLEKETALKKPRDEKEVSVLKTKEQWNL